MQSEPRILLVSDTYFEVQTAKGTKVFRVNEDGTVVLAGAISGNTAVTGNVSASGDFVGGAASAVLFGADDTDGSWQCVRSGTDWVVQKYITDAWVTQFTLSPAAANTVKITNAAANGDPQIAAIGSDTNIDLQLVAKGTGVVLLGGYGGVEATASAATATSQRGYVTTEALTTAAGAAYQLTLTNTKIGASAFVVVGVENGTNTQGIPVVSTVKVPAAGSVVIDVHNLHASQALNGTLLISFAIL